MSEEKDKDAAKADSICAGLALLGAPLWLMYSGWALRTLWLWFVVPLGLPALTTPQAMGLGLIAAFVTGRATAAQPKGVQILVYEILTPGWVVLVGWFIRRCF